MREGYAEAIDVERMERQLARCCELDMDHPPVERCAQKTVMQSVCPCMMVEENICNALAAGIRAEVERY